MAVTESDLLEVVAQCNETLQAGGLDKDETGRVNNRRNAALDEIEALQGGYAPERFRINVKALIEIGMPSVTAGMIVRDLLKRYKKDGNKVDAEVIKIVKQSHGALAAGDSIKDAPETKAQGDSSARTIAAAPSVLTKQDTASDDEPADWGSDDDAPKTNGAKPPSSTKSITTSTPTTQDTGAGAVSTTTPDASATGDKLPAPFTPEQLAELEELRREFGRVSLDLPVEQTEEMERAYCDSIVAEMIYLDRRADDFKRDYERRHGRICKYLDYLEKINEDNLRRYGWAHKEKGRQYCALPSGRISFKTSPAHFKQLDVALFRGSLIKLPKKVQESLKISKRTEEIIVVEYASLDDIYAHCDTIRERRNLLLKEMAGLQSNSDKWQKINKELEGLQLPEGLMWIDDETKMEVKPHPQKKGKEDADQADL